MSPAYLAGVTDSDGSLSLARKIKLSGRINYNPIYQLTWSETPRAKKFLDALVATYGGAYARCTPTGTKNYPNTRPVLKYHLSGTKIKRLIEDILPFLILKRRQARTIQRFLKFYRKGFNKHNLKPDRIIEFETFLYQKNKSFNTKNGTLCV